ncbi:MAG: hypothetical protein ACI9J3_003297 [Parvicellaceae bacterium]|jgi:hypothetical protein
MKLTNIRSVGRYTNPETGNHVNVKKGKHVDRSVDTLYYLVRGSRVIINDADFYRAWKKYDVTTTNFMYLITSSLIIADFDSCEKSSRTIDVSVFDLAKNEKALDKLNLISMYANTPKAIKFFCNYLASFGSKTSKEAEEKLLTNPTVRILIQDEQIRKDLKNILK